MFCFVKVTTKQSFQVIFLPVINVPQRATDFSNNYFLANISLGRMFNVMNCPLKPILVFAFCTIEKEMVRGGYVLLPVT